MRSITHIKGGVTAPQGFLAAGISCGIKKKGVRDLAMIFSPRPSTAAGSFTTNRVQAAPVKLDRERLKKGWLQAVVVNSGAANACTGRRGYADAEATALHAARALRIDPSLVAVCSTGKIGIYLPMDRIRRGVGKLAGIVKRGGNPYAARAIMTTDTRPKEAAVEFTVGGKTVRVGGMAKGAGMICPRMVVAGAGQATMLAFLATDAAVSAPRLRAALRRSLPRSFNRITVDADRSTNDTVILMAGGESGVRIPATGALAELFDAAVAAVAGALARMIAADGEGATKFIAITVKGARRPADAYRAGMAAANSPLFKSTLYGETPNWGRLMSALGASGAFLREEKVRAWLGKVKIIDRGRLVPSPRGAVRAEIRKKELGFIVDLGLGNAAETVYTCDLSPEYVEINKE